MGSPALVLSEEETLQRRARAKVTYALGLGVLLGVALFLRLDRLDAVGVSEDEARKIEAVEAYRRGDFSPNAEHPMLMKGLLWLSLSAAKRWNHTIAVHRPSWRISEETALRLPNAVVGALTTLVLFLFAREMFDPLIGGITAVLWATGVNAIAINRIAKEDTLMVFFMWLAFFFFMKAKHMGPEDMPRRQWLYRLSGASFGLMLASKYFPHYMGLIFLYNYMRPHDRQTNAPLGRRAMLGFFLAFALTFVMTNPMLFHPETLRYLAVYLTETTVPHHGYEMMGELYYNNAWKLEGRTPLYFYGLFLLVKTPAPLLLAFVLGVIWIVSWTRSGRFAAPLMARSITWGILPVVALLGHFFIPVVFRVILFTALSFVVAVVLVLRGRKEEGPFFLRFMLVFWIVPYTLFGSKWLRYTLSLMPLVYMTAAVGIALVIREGIGKMRHALVRRVAIGGGLLFFLVLPAWEAFAARPYYLLYVNEVGGGEARRAYYFPHDEVYDAGMREALAFIAARAPRGSRVAHDAPGVVRFYSQRFGRGDLVSLELSSPAFDLATCPRPLYVIVQKGRRYFENERWLEQLRRSHRPIFEVWIEGVRTTQVYEIVAGPGGVSPPFSSGEGGLSRWRLDTITLATASETFEGGGLWRR